jgi:hypothetical protein
MSPSLRQVRLHRRRPVPPSLGLKPDKRSCLWQKKPLQTTAAIPRYSYPSTKTPRRYQIVSGVSGFKGNIGLFTVRLQSDLGDGTNTSKIPGFLPTFTGTVELR